jgi:hypothetical protein
MPIGPDVNFYSNFYSNAKLSQARAVPSTRPPLYTYRMKRGIPRMYHYVRHSWTLPYSVFCRVIKEIILRGLLLRDLSHHDCYHVATNFCATACTSTPAVQHATLEVNMSKRRQEKKRSSNRRRVFLRWHRTPQSDLGGNFRGRRRFLGMLRFMSPHATTKYMIVGNFGKW